MKLKESITSTWNCDNGDFWYDLAFGGYLRPEDFLDETDAAQVNAAIKILMKFERLLESRSEEQDDD